MAPFDGAIFLFMAISTIFCAENKPEGTNLRPVLKPNYQGKTQSPTQ
ncbi:MAG: hypothetical protein ACKVOK_06270 [Flavobacteriales bacterium]